MFSRHVGNEIILKLRFGDGDEREVARLVRDDEQSEFALETSGAQFALSQAFTGDIGQFRIIGVRSEEATDEGHAHMRIFWKYTVFYEKGGGAPINRLQIGESATESLVFLTEAGGGFTASSKVTFTAAGRVEMPLMLLADTSPGADPSEEFPLALRPPDDIRPWNWWRPETIAGSADGPGLWRPHTVTVNPDDGLVLRFVPIDVEGDYFQPAGTKGTPRTYGDIASFISTYVRLRLYESDYNSDPAAILPSRRRRIPTGLPDISRCPTARTACRSLNFACARTRRPIPPVPFSPCLVPVRRPGTTRGHAAAHLRCVSSI